LIIRKNSKKLQSQRKKKLSMAMRKAEPSFGLSSVVRLKQRRSAQAAP